MLARLLPGSPDGGGGEIDAKVQRNMLVRCGSDSLMLHTSLYIMRRRLVLLTEGLYEGSYSKI